MPVALAAALAVAAIVAVAAAPSPAAPQRELLIVPGQQIGKVRLGMSFAQVRRALGPPTLVNRRERTGFGRYVEYDWGWGRWIVGFSGRGSTLRVSLVATTIRRERTHAGVGVGSLLARVRTAYARQGLRCPASRPFGIQPACRLRSRSRATTYFPTEMKCTDPRYVNWYNCPTGKHVPVVYEVLIRSAAAPAPTYE